MKIEKNSRQVPSIPTYTADKKYCDLLYGYLQELSYCEVIDGEVTRYVDSSSFNYTTLGEAIGLKRVTASKKFKYLVEELGLIEFIEKEKRYKLINLDKSISSLVPYETLRQLNHSLSQNSISLYVYLMKRWYAEGQNEYQVTMSQMKSFIGIATTTTSNNDVINDILNVLTLLGLVKVEKRQIEKDNYAIFVTAISNTIEKAVFIEQGLFKIF